MNADVSADAIVLLEAGIVIGHESLAMAALRALTTEQLRQIVWVGLVDDGWSRVFDELDRRGVEL